MFSLIPIQFGRVDRGERGTATTAEQDSVCPQKHLNIRPESDRKKFTGQTTQLVKSCRGGVLNPL